MTSPTPIDVRFAVDGIDLVGQLRIPETAAGPLPALLFTGPFTGVKEQVTGHYAELLSQRGFVTLTFDHRNFGASGGEPRQHEDAQGKLGDLLAATSYLAGHGAVDAGRLGCVGICLGGGYALRHSAFDPRIKALALVAGAFNDPKAMRRRMGGPGAYRAAMAAFAEVAQRQFDTGETEYIPAVTDTGGDAAMPGQEPFDYYGTDRSASPGWVNRMTRASVRELLTFDAAIGADFIDAPTLIVHGRVDAYCAPEDAADIYSRMSGTKELIWLDTTNHIDLYDVPDYVEPAVARITEWMAHHL